MGGYTTEPSLKSYFKIYPDPKSQLIHCAPAAEKVGGFRALVLRDVLTETQELKLIEPFAVDRSVVEKCLGRECWKSEPLVFCQTSEVGSVIEEYSNAQPRFVMSCTAYLNWLRYMENAQPQVYSSMSQYMTAMRGPETTCLETGLHMYGGGNIETGQELDTGTRCKIEVKFEWNWAESSPKMYFVMKGAGSEIQPPLEIPYMGFRHLQKGVRRLREELRYYKREPGNKKSRQSANGTPS